MVDFYVILRFFHGSTVPEVDPDPAKWYEFGPDPDPKHWLEVVMFFDQTKFCMWWTKNPNCIPMRVNPKIFRVNISA